MIFGDVKVRIGHIFEPFCEVSFDLFIEVGKIASFIFRTEFGFRMFHVGETEFLGCILCPGHAEELREHEVVVGAAEKSFRIETLKRSGHGASKAFDALKGFIG